LPYYSIIKRNINMTDVSEQKPIVTRFAPSPTGYLHIGGARTALFNYLYAKRFGGKFLLRIEDTDRERSTQAAVGAILQGLDWLGLKHDGEPIYQFSRAARHSEIANTLISKGKAFKCYMNAEETQIQREIAMKEGRALRSTWRDAKVDGKGDYVVRLRAPENEEQIIIDDKVQGKVKTLGANIDDLVLLRTDGTPTYMLAVVVDDYDMGITHIIRGDDHLINAARQSVLIDAMGWERPIYAHIPLIHGDDGKKLSKRHGALAVGEYENFGYLPEAILSYLLRLGWSKGDLDIVPIEDAINIFDFDGLGKSPSRLDFAKLAQVNAHFIRLADDKRLADLIKNYAKSQNILLGDAEILQIEKTLPFIKERAKTINDLLSLCEFAWKKAPIEINEKARSTIEKDTNNIIDEAQKNFKQLEDWNAISIKEIIDRIAENKGIGLGKVGPIIRAAVTGGLIAPDLHQTLALIGKNETLVRLEEFSK
jgi:glutamyl-tRNA synthetase